MYDDDDDDGVMSLAILGGERFGDQETLDTVLNSIRRRVPFHQLIVTHQKRGVDQLAANYAMRYNDQITLVTLAPFNLGGSNMTQREGDRAKLARADYVALFVDRNADSKRRQQRFLRIRRRSHKWVCMHVFGGETGAIYETTTHAARARPFRTVDDWHRNNGKSTKVCQL